MAINTEELFLINKTCTELSCSANLLEETDNIDVSEETGDIDVSEETGDIDVSELYINIGTRRRRENRQYVCETIASSGVFPFLPFARPHIHQPRSNCNGESWQFFIVVDDCATSDDGMYSAINVCDEDGIYTKEMNGGDCTGAPINTEELFLINKTCTELSCSANLLEETDDIDVR